MYTFSFLTYKQKQIPIFHKLKKQTKMKKLLLFCSITFLAFFTHAQNVAINTDGTTANGSALLDVKSITKGFLMPRMTSAQRGAIVTPVVGLLVFDTDTKTIWTHDGAAWKNLSATGSGSFSLPFGQTVSIAGPAINITNTGTVVQAVASSISTPAINGTNNNTGGMGVFGSSSAATGIGVIGQTGSGTGVFGNSIDGVGVKASSTNGLALQVNGKVKIAGGNTNPSNGAVLTSDASGNAVWKKSKVGFHGMGINYSFDDINPDQWDKVILIGEVYDFANNFTPYAGSAAPPADASTFTVPVEGVYTFNVLMELIVPNQTASNCSGSIRLRINRGGNVFTVVDLPPVGKTDDGNLNGSFARIDFHFSTDYPLLAGDKVYLEIKQLNPGNVHAILLDSYNFHFSGRLAMAF